MKTNSRILRALLICLVLVGAGRSAFATHLRGTTISWSPTGVTGQVQFTISYSQRQSFGGCSVTGCPVGSTLPVAFSFGDGATGTFNTQVTSVNTAEDYLVSTATLLHTYTTAGPFTAFYQNTARVSTIKSGHDQQMRMETTVSPFASPANHSPVVSEPAIITLPLQNTTGFVISASDLDRDTLSYRLSTAQEMYGSSPFSCTIGQPPGLSVNSSTGQVTWDTTQIVKAGCGYTAPVSGDLWTVQFMVQDLDSKGNVKSKVPLDIILKFISSAEAPPTIALSNPGPITVQAGTPITFTATGNDVAPNSRVTLNATGLPIGATSSNLNQQLLPPVVSTFNWTPTAAQVGSYVITYSATNDTFEQVLASVTIYVQNILPPTLGCSAPLTTQYNMPINIPLTVSDPQADAVSVMWSVDGTLVRTDTVPASNQTTTLTLGQTFSTLGVHTVNVRATDTDNQVSACSTTVTVDKAGQTITFAPLPNATFGDADAMLMATTTSGLPITYTATGACTIVNGAVHITGAGMCSVTASQPGDANYNAATSVTQSFTVAQAPQTIAFTAPAAATYGDGPITLAATGGASGNPILYTVTGPATLSGNTLTITGAGNVVVTANQAGNANYSAAAAVSQTIVVNQAPQTIAFNAPATATYGDGPITLAAAGGASGNPVTYTVTGPATLSGNTLTITGAGNVVVTANQAGNANYAAATAVSQTVVVSKAAQAITFNAPATANYGDGPITLAAAGGASGNPVTYTVTGPATLSGNTLTITGAGNVVVTANQAGNANYAAATAVSQTIVVSKVAQTIAFNPPASVTYGGGPITLAATGGASGNPVTYTVTGPATLSGNVLTFTGVGNVVVTANQAGNASYAAATSVVKTIVVNPAAQVIAFTAPALLPVNSTYTLTGTGGASGNPVTYTVTGPASVSGNVLTITGSGTVVVTANQAGNASYSAAAPVMQSINAKLRATVTLTAASTSFSYPNSTNLTACVTLVNGMAPTGTISIYDGTTLLTTMTVQGGGCIYYYISPSPSAGTHTLTAYYNDANLSNIFSAPLTLTVAPGSVTTEVDCWVHDAPFGGNIQCDANPDSGPSSGYMTYSYDNGPLVTVQMNAASHAVFTVLAPTVGTHTIQIVYPAQGNWGSSALPLQTFIVRLAPTNVTLMPSSYYTTAGNSIKLTTSITSTSTVNPNSVGTVSFYDGSTLLGTVPVDANGTASLNTPALTSGTHSFTSAFSGTNQYASGTGAATVSIGN